MCWMQTLECAVAVLEVFDQAMTTVAYGYKVYRDFLGLYIVFMGLLNMYQYLIIFFLLTWIPFVEIIIR